MCSQELINLILDKKVNKNDLKNKWKSRQENPFKDLFISLETNKKRTINLKTPNNKDFNNIKKQYIKMRNVKTSYYTKKNSKVEAERA